MKRGRPAPEERSEGAAGEEESHLSLQKIHGRSGGTGIRDGLKIRWPQGLVGSSPTFGTKLSLSHKQYSLPKAGIYFQKLEADLSAPPGDETRAAGFGGAERRRSRGGGVPPSAPISMIYQGRCT